MNTYNRKNNYFFLKFQNINKLSLIYIYHTSLISKLIVYTKNKLKCNQKLFLIKSIIWNYIFNFKNITINI